MGTIFRYPGGYYYHAGQYGSRLMCFIYDPNGNCVQVGYI